MPTTARVERIQDFVIGQTYHVTGHHFDMDGIYTLETYGPHHVRFVNEKDVINLTKSSLYFGGVQLGKVFMHQGINADGSRSADGPKFEILLISEAA